MKQRILTWGAACSLLLLATASSAQGLKAADQGAGGMRLKTPGTATAGTSTQLSAPRSADYIVAVVNSEPITNVEVQQQYERLRAQPEAGQVPADMLRRQALDLLIAQKIQLQMAAERGITIDNLALQQAEENVARQNSLNLAQMHTRLEQEGIPLATFRADLKKQLIIQKLREAEVDAKVRVSDLEVDQYLREQKAKAGMADAVVQLNLGHLLVAVPENAPPEQVQKLQAKAQQAADKIRAGEAFDAAVQEFSDVPLGQGGGAIGLRPADRYPELFVNATRSTPVGGVVGPVRSPAGFHILKVVEKTSGEVPAMVTQNHARHILLRPGPKLSEAEALERLQDYRRRVIDKQDSFETLARRYSEDGSAKNGGDLGWTNPHQFVPEFEDALNALQPGDISQPIASRFGIHLIELVDRRQAKLNQREQRDMVRNIVREKKLETAFNTWAQEARARAYVEMREPPQ